MTDVNNFLDTASGDVKEPKNLPAGEYLAVITGYKPDKVKNDKETPFVRLFLKPIEVLDGAATDEDLATARRIEADQWMSEAAQPATKRFLVKTLGIDDENGGKTFRQMFEDAVGREVRIFTKIELVGKNKDLPVVRVEKFASAA